MNIKRYLTLILILALCLTLVLPATAAGRGLKTQSPYSLQEIRYFFSPTMAS